MPTNLDGLKAIYEALGGQADDVTSVDTNADMLIKIADLIAAGALPPVTAADNGKVLMVKNGAWAPAVIPDELPEVTTEDNGKILKVVNAEWAVATN